jgi:hypothetical protein
MKYILRCKINVLFISMTGEWKMTDELNLENIQKFFEQAAKANADAWTSQSAYFDGLIKRNIECFRGLGDARMSSFKEMSEAKTFNQAFESNLAFEEKLREDLSALQEENIKSWEGLMENLKAIYTPAPKKVSKTKKAA